VRRPAKVEVCESQRGAETIPRDRFLARLEQGVLQRLTILEEDSQALLDEKIGIENNESERERKHVITGSFLEEISDCFLRSSRLSALRGPVMHGSARKIEA
jgi:hypothetical protein